MAINPDWPIPPNGVRLITPEFLLVKLKDHPLTSGLYPISIGHYPKAIGHEMERTNQNTHLLIYCTAGKAKLFYDNKEHLIRSGDLILIRPQKLHRYIADNNDPWSVYWVHFDGSLASNFAERLLMKMNNGLSNIVYQTKIVADFDTLLALRERGYTATNVIHAVHLLQQLLSYLALQLRLHKTLGSTELDIEVLEALMMEHLHTNLNLDTLAERAKLSKYHFSKKFKELTDQSPIQHFLNMKMQHACYLLDSTSHSVKQIGASLGYNDAYYFSRLFKKIIGLSPSLYRTKNR